jgi:hypothetical protein
MKFPPVAAAAVAVPQAAALAPPAPARSPLAEGDGLAPGEEAPNAAAGEAEEEEEEFKFLNEDSIYLKERIDKQ